MEDKSEHPNRGRHPLGAISPGTNAPQGIINSDLEESFIKAEVISLGDLAEIVPVPEVRYGGKARLEGKDNVTQADGVVEFRRSEALGSAG